MAQTSVIERAFEIVKKGHCVCVSDIARRLALVGFDMPYQPLIPFAEQATKEASGDQSVRRALEHSYRIYNAYGHDAALLRLIRQRRD